MKYGNLFPYLLAFGVCVFVAACTSQSESPQGESKTLTHASKDEMVFDTPADQQNHPLVGLREEEAKRRARDSGTPFRVAMRDGRPRALTKDHVPGRLNATIKEGIVTAIHVEGGNILRFDTPLP